MKTEVDGEEIAELLFLVTCEEKMSQQSFGIARQKCKSFLLLENNYPGASDMKN